MLSRHTTAKYSSRENILEHLESDIASNIVASSAAVRENRISFYCCCKRCSEMKLPSSCVLWDGSIRDGVFNYKIDGASTLIINSSPDKLVSFYMERVCVDVIVRGRSKCLTMIDCRESNVQVDVAPVVGIYLIRCDSVRVVMGTDSHLNFTGFERCYECSVVASVQRGFRFTSFCSFDVTLNGFSLPANPFMNGMWELEEDKFSNIRPHHEGEIHIACKETMDTS